MRLTLDTLFDTGLVLRTEEEELTSAENGVDDMNKMPHLIPPEYSSNETHELKQGGRRKSMKMSSRSRNRKNCHKRPKSDKN